jgi:hypothetical protein
MLTVVCFAAVQMSSVTLKLRCICYTYTFSLRDDLVPRVGELGFSSKGPNLKTPKNTPGKRRCPQHQILVGKV